MSMIVFCEFGVGHQTSILVVNERFVEMWILGVAVMEGRYVLAKLNACWEL